MKLTKQAYTSLIERDIDYLKEHLTVSMERTHIIDVLNSSIKLLYDFDSKRQLQEVIIKANIKHGPDDPYRIRHKSGLYYNPQRNMSNLSTNGKIYNSTRGWNTFINNPYMIVGHQNSIYNEIFYQEKYSIDYTKEYTSYSGNYLRIKFNRDEWEQEYI